MTVWFRRQSIALLTLLALGLLAPGSVVCESMSGHAAIESVLSGCCGADDAPVSDCADECTDTIRVVEAVVSQREPELPQNAPAPSFQLGERSDAGAACAALIVPAAPGPAPPRPAPESLRTVVLRS